MRCSSAEKYFSRLSLLKAYCLLLIATLCLLVIPSVAIADTDLPPVIEEDMTWTEAGSPYKAYGSSVTISSNATVTAEPGVLVWTAGHLYVEGTLNVQGASGNKVTFTSFNDSISNEWGGVHYRPGSSGAIDQAIFRYGAEYGADDGMLKTEIDISVTNSTFDSGGQSGAGLFVVNGSPTITGSTFTNNYRGIRVDSPADPLIDSNTVENSWGDAGIIYYGSVLMVAGRIRVINNTIRNNAINGLYQVTNGGYGFDGGDVSGNYFTGNLANAIDLEGGHTDLLTAHPPKNLHQNTASANGCDCARLTHYHDIEEPTTWGPGMVIVPVGELDVKDTLTISAGAVLKGTGSSNSRIRVNSGHIDVQGAAGNRATFTTLADDSYGGDTQNNGQTPIYVDWGGITVSGTGQLTMNEARMLYGGDYGYGTDYGMLSFDSVTGQGSSITNSTIANYWQRGVWVADYAGPHPTIEHNEFKNIYEGFVYAIDKWGSDTFYAPFNDFDCDNGPNPYGCGQRISDSVDADPWTSTNLHNGQCPGDSRCGKIRDPVSMSTGSFIHSHTDLSLAGKGPPLEFSRAYYSQDTADAGLGRGWSHSALLNASQDSEGNVTIRRADGRRDIYTFTDPGYSPPPGIHDVLEKEADDTYTLTTLDRTVYRFDQTGRIASITDDHDQAITYNYDGNGRLASMTDSSEQSISFGYNGSNHIFSATDSTGRTVSYTYDAAGNLETVTDPLNGVAIYNYDSADRMTSIRDPEDTTFITNTYDSQDRVVSQQDGEGNDWSLSYQEGQTYVTDPEGDTEIFGFDSALRITSDTDQVGNTTSLIYDSNGNIDQITRPGGAQYSFTYDSKGNLLSKTHPESGTRTYTYDVQNHLTDLTDARNNSWSYNWSASHDLADITDPKGNTTFLTYDSAGLPITITDPENHTTTFAYDSRGNLTSSTNPLNDSTTYTYDARNYLTSRTEPGKNPAIYSRNALGDLLSTTDPESSTTSFTYNKNGELLTLTDPGNNTWQIERNSMYLPTAIVDPKLNRTEISYDANLNTVGITDRRGNTTSYTYDPANRITQITRPEGGTYSFDYDARDNVASLTDPRGKISSYTYDLVDRLTSVDEPESTSTSYTYDAEHNLTSTTDPRNNTTSYTYDSLNLMTQLDQPLNKQTSLTYDNAQNTKAKTTAAGTLDYNYDTADQITEIKKGAQTLRSFGYDPVGRLDQATDDAGITIALQYDQVDRPTQITDGLGQTTNRSYDAIGNLVSQTDARGTVGYAYDELSRLTSLTDPQSKAVSFGYDNEGNLIAKGLPNGVDTNNTYDKDGRMTRTKSTKDSNILQDFKYTYDVVGNPTSKQDKSGRRTSYYYDGLNRLIRESSGLLTHIRPSPTNRSRYSLSHILRKPYWSTNYTYDKAGNRTKAGSKEYAYDALNQLESSTDGTTYTYDGAGHLTQKTKGADTTTFSWDLLDELTQVQDSQDTTNYTYDALDHRSTKTSGGNTETAHYGDLSDIPIFNTDGTGQLTTRYVAAWPDVSSHTKTINSVLSNQVNMSKQASIGQVLGPVAPINPVEGLSGTKDPAGLVEERENSQTRYPLADAHGDITAVTDSTGSVSYRSSYDPWGVQSPVTQREMGYLGAYLRMTDPGTGLTQMGARQYEPMLGRFMSEDRVLGRSYMGQSLNRHSYAFDRSLVLYDLDGQIPSPKGIWDSIKDTWRGFTHDCRKTRTCEPPPFLPPCPDRAASIGSGMCYESKYSDNYGRSVSGKPPAPDPPGRVPVIPPGPYPPDPQHPVPGKDPVLRERGGKPAPTRPRGGFRPGPVFR